MIKFRDLAHKPEKIKRWIKQTYRLPETLDGWQHWPLYFALLAIYPVIFLYAFNINEVTLDMLWLPLLVAIIIGGALLIISRAFLSSWSRASLWSGVALIVLYGYGRVYPWLPDMLVKFGEIVFGKKTLTIFLAIIILASLAVWLWRSKKFNPRKANLALNGLTTLLLLFSLIDIVPVEASRFVKYSEESVNVVADSIETRDLEKPDVYYIVFDRYGGNKTLQELYGFDNSAYHEMLKDKGFYVAEDSMANYPATAFSLSSTLNMKYHEALDPNTSTEATEIYPLFKSPAVAQEFKNHGYKYIQLGSWYWQTAQGVGLADENYAFSQQQQILGVDAFSSKLLSTTLALPVIERFWPEILKLNYHDSHYRHTEYQIDKLKDIVEAESDEPKFVFMHILVPHDPFVYDEKCNYISEEQSSQNTLVQNYLNMVQCANLLTEDIINEIRQNTDHDPAIIVQADEGPYPIKDWGEPIGALESKTTPQLRERFRIQNAYYFPNQDYSQLYPAITPVNSFKVLLNNLFDQDNNLLPDINYRFQDGEHKFNFINVTDQLRNGQ